MSWIIHIYNNDQNVASRVNVKGCSGEISEGNGKHVTGHWKKGHPCHKVARTLAELCSVLGKVELINAEVGYFAEISMQSIEGMAWFPWDHLTVRCKRRE